MKSDDERDIICQRFNKINWHDSKLIEINIAYISDYHRYDIYLKIKLLTNPMPGHYDWRDAILRIRDCTIIRMNVDLTAKLTCADDISVAYCEKETPLKKQIERVDLTHEENPLADYLHFHLGLIVPGGDVDIFAKNFDLEP